MGPIHPDAEDAILILLDVQPNEGELAAHEVEETIAVEQEHLIDIPQPQAEEDDDITEAMF
jgi:hypothetical protein